MNREGAIAVMMYFKGIFLDSSPTVNALDMAISALEQPERKKGKWTENNSCQFCGFQPWYEKDIHTLSYCPNCGADMRSEKE